MSEYVLMVKDGRVEYLMESGKDIVKAATTKSSAEWMLKRGKPEIAVLPGYEEYPIRAGKFYFRGSWMNDHAEAEEPAEAEPAKTEPEKAEPEKKRRKRTKDIVCE